MSFDALQQTLSDLLLRLLRHPSSSSSSSLHHPLLQTAVAFHSRLADNPASLPSPSILDALLLLSSPHSPHFHSVHPFVHLLIAAASPAVWTRVVAAPSSHLPLSSAALHLFLPTTRPPIPSPLLQHLPNNLPSLLAALSTPHTWETYNFPISPVPTPLHLVLHAALRHEPVPQLTPLVSQFHPSVWPNLSSLLLTQVKPLLPSHLFAQQHMSQQPVLTGPSSSPLPTPFALHVLDTLATIPDLAHSLNRLPPTPSQTQQKPLSTRLLALFPKSQSQALPPSLPCTLQSALHVVLHGLPRAQVYEPPVLQVLVDLLDALTTTFVHMSQQQPLSSPPPPPPPPLLLLLEDFFHFLLDEQRAQNGLPPSFSSLALASFHLLHALPPAAKEHPPVRRALDLIARGNATEHRVRHVARDLLHDPSQSSLHEQ